MEMNSAALEGSDGTNDLSEIDFPEIRNLEEVMALSKQSSLLAETASVPVGSAVSAANALRSSQSAKVIADGVSIPLVAEDTSETTPPPEREERNSNVSAKMEHEQMKGEKKGDDLLKPQKSEKESPQPPPALRVPSPESKKANRFKNPSWKNDEMNHSTSPISSGSNTQKLLMDIKRTKDGVEVISCCLAVYLNLQHKGESSPYEYSIHKVEISGFLEEDMIGRFRPFVDISVGDDGTWSSSTAPMQDAGSEVQWLFPDKKQAFMITEGQKREGYSLNCVVSRLANEDDDKTGPTVYLLGKGKARL